MEEFGSFSATSSPCLTYMPVPGVKAILVSNILGTYSPDDAICFLMRGHYIYDAYSKIPLTLLPGSPILHYISHPRAWRARTSVPALADCNFDIGSFKDVYRKQIKSVDYIAERLMEGRSAVTKWKRCANQVDVDMRDSLIQEIMHAGDLEPAEAACVQYLQSCRFRRSSNV